MEDARKSQRTQDQTVNGLKHGHNCPRKQKRITEWAEEDATLLQAARRNREIYEVQTDDRDHITVTADAPLKLEKHCSRNSVHGEGRQPREPQAGATPSDDNEEESGSENKGACGEVTRQHMEHIAEKECVEAFTVAWYTSQVLLKKL